MVAKRRLAGTLIPTSARLHNVGRPVTGKPKPLPNIKPRVGGLVVTSVQAMDAGINHELVRLEWSLLEPTQGTYDWTTSDAALAGLPAGAFAKFGVQAGGHSPQWLKDMTGTVTITNTKDSTSAVCPYWWDSRMQSAWANLQTAMAARYDGDSRLKQVIACEAMAVYMEPFILGSDSASDQALWNAGLERITPQATAISTMLTNTLNAWQRTRVELPLHTTWEIPKGTGTFINQQNWTVLRDFINPFAITYGERIMFTDYGLGPSDTAPDTTGVTLANATAEYAWMKVRANLPTNVPGNGSGPCAYQVTFGPGVTHDGPNMLLIIQNCDDLNGSYLETSGYGAYLTTAQITAKDALLKANNAGL